MKKILAIILIMLLASSVYSLKWNAVMRKTIVATHPEWFVQNNIVTQNQSFDGINITTGYVQNNLTIIGDFLNSSNLAVIISGNDTYTFEGNIGEFNLSNSGITTFRDGILKSQFGWSDLSSIFGQPPGTLGYGVVAFSNFGYEGHDLGAGSFSNIWRDSNGVFFLRASLNDNDLILGSVGTPWNASIGGDLVVYRDYVGTEVFKIDSGSNYDVSIGSGTGSNGGTASDFYIYNESGTAGFSVDGTTGNTFIEGDINWEGELKPEGNTGNNGDLAIKYGADNWGFINNETMINLVVPDYWIDLYSMISSNYSINNGDVNVQGKLHLNQSDGGTTATIEVAKSASKLLIDMSNPSENQVELCDGCKFNVKSGPQLAQFRCDGSECVFTTSSGSLRMSAITTMNFWGGTGMNFLVLDNVGNNHPINFQVGALGDFFWKNKSNDVLMEMDHLGNIYNRAKMSIGTTDQHSGSEQLHVAGDVNITNNLSVDINTLFVDSNSNKVGIGVSSPSEELDVNGSLFLRFTNGQQDWKVWDAGAGYFTMQSQSSGSDASVLIAPNDIDGSDKVALYLTTLSTGGGANEETLVIESESGAAFLDSIVTYATGTGTAHDLTLYTGSNTNQLYLKNTGNVGVGINSPEGRLHTATGNGINYIYHDTYDDSSNPTYMFLRKSRSDTIGTKTETIDGNNLGGIGFQGVNSGSSFFYGSIIRSEQEGSSGATWVPSNLYLESSSNSAQNTNQLVLNTNNNVGIGVETPNTKLQVVGTVNATGYASGNKVGVTDSSSYWLCTAADCSTKCQVEITDGLITGCT